MPNKPGPISYPDLKQVKGGDFRAQEWPLEGVDTFSLWRLLLYGVSQYFCDLVLAIALSQEQG